MNPDSKLYLELLEEMQRLLHEQNERLDKRFADIDTRFAEADANLDHRFTESDINIERRILDSELRQDERVTGLEQAAGIFESWRQETQGVVGDLRTEVGKLCKHWDRAVKEQSSTSP